MAENDELYTGYLPEAPPGIAARMKKTVVLLFALAIALALALLTAQQPFNKGIYEFGVVRDFEGVVRAEPYPTLEIERPGSAMARSRYYLVNPFKHGARLAELDGQRVRVRGSLLYRDDKTMIEILPGEIESLGAAAPTAAGHSYGTHTFVGSIVDSKCYLGIMKPGSGKSHRACAARCISGGIPPLFLVRDAAGPMAQLLLVGADGRAVNREVLAMVAEPLEIRGEVTRAGDLWILKADPSTYRRLE